MPPIVKIAAVITAAAACIVALLAAALLVHARGGEQAEQDRTIDVTGSGFVLVAPDHATVTATAEGRDADARDALNAADARMERVLDAVRAEGIDKDQLSTSAVQSRRAPQLPGRQRSEPGEWVATISLRIEIDDLDRVGSVLAAANRAGAQQLSGPSYSVRDHDEAYATALQMAMDDARAKAETMAKQSDAAAGDLVSATESAVRQPRAFETSMAAAGRADEAIAVTPGETQRIEATVSTSYELVDDD